MAYSLASGRRGLAAALTALVAVALAVAVAGRGCGVDDDTPEAAVRAFDEAARSHNREAVYEMLGPETRERLEEAAARATELVGGSTRYVPADLISVPSAEIRGPRSYVLAERDDSRALVDVIDEQGKRWSVSVVEVDDRWRIEVPEFGQ